MSVDLTINDYYNMKRQGTIKQLERAQLQHNKDVTKKFDEWLKKFAEPSAVKPPASRRKLTWIDECGKGDLCNTVLFPRLQPEDDDIYELPRQPATEPDEDDF